MCDQLAREGSVDGTSEQQVHETARKLYTPIKTWQTRVLKLHARNDEDVLEADLLVAGLAHLDGLVIGMNDDIVTYEAISYSWGERTSYVRTICNGLEYGVNTSLAQALRRFRYADRARYLWADAVCINQADNDEKSFQVRNMFTIYRKAVQVLVWLGKEEKHIAEAIDFVNVAMDATDGNTRKTVIKSMLSDEIKAGLKGLYSRSWNRRVWVQQEIFAAHDVTVFCGPHMLSFQSYQRAFSFLSEHELIDEDFCALSQPNMAGDERLLNLQSKRNSVLSNLRAGKALRSDTVHWPNKNLHQITGLEEILVSSRGLEASDPRDVVYALFPMMDHPYQSPAISTLLPELQLAIDYSKPLSDLLQNITRYIMNRDRSLRVLKWRSSKSRLALRIPTWTVDWKSIMSASSSTFSSPVYGDFSSSSSASSPSTSLVSPVTDSIPERTPLPIVPLRWQEHSFGDKLILRGLILGEVVSATTESEHNLRNLDIRSHLQLSQTGYAGYRIVWTSSARLLSLPWGPPVQEGDVWVQVDGSNDPILLRPHESACYDYVASPSIRLTLALMLHDPQLPNTTTEEDYRDLHAGLSRSWGTQDADEVDRRLSLGAFMFEAHKKFVVEYTSTYETYIRYFVVQYYGGTGCLPA